MKRSISFISLLFLALLMVYPGSSSRAASASQAIAPASITTLTGGTVGTVANLTVQDQSGTADIPSKYVTFTTPGTTTYKGYRQFSLPANIAISNITDIKVKVNYKGLAKANQTWLWSLYDWTAAKWVFVGDNTSATANTWTAITFSTTLPKRFVNASRVIRLFLQSNNVVGDAKLDFESINVTYTSLKCLRRFMAMPC